MKEIQAKGRMIVVTRKRERQKKKEEDKTKGIETRATEIALYRASSRREGWFSACTWKDHGDIFARRGHS